VLHYFLLHSLSNRDIPVTYRFTFNPDSGSDSLLYKSLYFYSHIDLEINHPFNRLILKKMSVLLTHRESLHTVK